MPDAVDPVRARLATLAPLIRDTATAYALPLDLLRGQIVAESNADRRAYRYEPAYFDRYVRNNPKAKGYAYGPMAACSMGLLQILLETALEIGFDGLPWDLFDSATNLHWGGLYLRQLWDQVGGDLADYPKVLAMYNGGPGAAKTRPFRNQAYVDRVLRLATRYTA